LADGKKKGNNMLRRHLNNNTKAQIFIEYTMVVGVIVMIVFAMGPMIKRGIQGMVKVVADQIGNQENAEQTFEDSGYLESSYVSTRAFTDKIKTEFAGVTNYSFGDVMVLESQSVANLGFTEER